MPAYTSTPPTFTGFNVLIIDIVDSFSILLQDSNSCFMLEIVLSISDGLLPSPSMIDRHDVASDMDSSTAFSPISKCISTPSLPADVFLLTKIAPISSVSITCMPQHAARSTSSISTTLISSSSIRSNLTRIFEMSGSSLLMTLLLTEWFSRMTLLAKRTATEILSHPMSLSTMTYFDSGEMNILTMLSSGS